MKAEYVDETVQPIGEMTDKDEIVKEVRKYLSRKANNSLIDLNGFIEQNCPLGYRHSAFIRDIANKMERTGQYKIQETGDRFLIKPIPLDDRIYNKTRWISPIISFLFSLAAIIISIIALRNK